MCGVGVFVVCIVCVVCIWGVWEGWEGWLLSREKAEPGCPQGSLEPLEGGLPTLCLRPEALSYLCQSQGCSGKALGAPGKGPPPAPGGVPAGG